MKVCIVFTGNQLQNWLDCGLVSNLRKHFVVDLIAVDTIVSQDIFKSFKYGNVSYETSLFYSINQVVKRKLSKTFQQRLYFFYFGYINSFGYSLKKGQKISVLVQKCLSFFRYVLRNPLPTAAYIPVLNSLLLRLVRLMFNHKISSVAKTSRNFFKELDYDLFLFPSTGAELIIFEFLALLQTEDKNSMMVIENWDNLTSKTVFPIKPNFITVMGEKSKEQAQNIHGFESDAVCITGLPRFEGLLTRGSVSADTDFHSKTHEYYRILYLGFSLPYNEISTLKSLENKLDSRFGLNKYEITYRPHPYRKLTPHMLPFRSLTGSRINISSNISDQSGLIKRLPLVDKHYVENLRSYDLIITTPTTMVLEVMLLGLPCILDCIDDGIHLTTPKLALHSYTHLEDLNEIKQLVRANSVDEIADLTYQFYENKLPSRSDYSLSPIYALNQKFSTYLAEFVLANKDKDLE